MGELIQFLVDLDREAMRTSVDLRWGPATGAFALASAWWVKGPLLFAAGWLADLYGRRKVPLVGLAAVLSYSVASAANVLLKGAFDRNRPPEAMNVDALVSVPESASFPSGHAMTAFAAAGAVALLAPRLRWPILGLAAIVALSRVYLGVHFWLDVIAGATLGLAIGLGLAWPLRPRCRARRQQPAAAPA